LTATRFDFFNLPPEVLKGLADGGFEFCTPIQAEAMPVLLRGCDVAGQAHTGTGKTAAFLVTVISRLLGMSNRKTGLPQAIIMAPTRELSRQIFEEAVVLSRHTDISLLEVVGGIDYREQAEGLQKGTDIVIGTPGRIIDYYKQGILKTKDIKFLVIDEADRLLDLGFEKDMRFILRKLPHYEKRQSMLFSATLSYRVLELTYEFMNLPEFISVIPDKVTVAGIEQTLFHVGSDRKFQLLLGLLQREEFTRMLIFVNMKIAVDRLTRRLKGNGFPAETLQAHGALQERANQDFSGHGRGLARHPRGGYHPRGELRYPPGSRKLRPPHRPHRAGGQDRQSHLAGMRGVCSSPGAGGGDAGLQDPGGLARGRLVRRGPLSAGRPRAGRTARTEKRPPWAEPRA
jgi:superfamily II DNA/RNA helicase